jgi:hypothetical protein
MALRLGLSNKAQRDMSGLGQQRCPEDATARMYTWGRPARDAMFCKLLQGTTRASWYAPKLDVVAMD